jgi:hypothetical protein
MKFHQDANYSKFSYGSPQVRYTFLSLGIWLNESYYQSLHHLVAGLIQNFIPKCGLVITCALYLADPVFHYYWTCDGKGLVSPHYLS